MESSLKLTPYSVTKQTSTEIKIKDKPLYLIGSLWLKVQNQHYNYRKAYKPMVIKEHSIESHLGQETKKKEIKDFLEFNKNKSRAYPNLWDTIKAVHSTK